MNYFKKFFKLAYKSPLIYPDDSFIVSYPKSGNTWVRFLIANLIKTSSDDIDFHSAVKYVPEIGVHHKEISRLSRPRTFKSHALYTNTYPKVIYIVRDVRDVYVSYYHYLKKSLPENTSFSDFIRKEDLYPSRWSNHVDSWINKPNVYLVIKYEDLLKNTFQELRKIVNVMFKYKIHDRDLISAIEESTFKKMQTIEKQKGRPFQSKEKELRSSNFVRKGIKGDWINYLSKNDEKFILLKEGETMKYLGYI